MSRFVYLAGPVTGMSYDDATDWREYCRKHFRPGIIGLSPMRGKEYLQHEQMISDTYEQHVRSTARGIMTSDHFDCINADMILANFLGAKTPSLGTVMEVAWGWQAKKPVIGCMEDGGRAFSGRTPSTGNPHEHAMINEAISFKVNSLDSAISIVNAMLSVYVEQNER